jgi:DNA invertase Pin-like site-specific DNA recombinase
MKNQNIKQNQKTGSAIYVRLAKATSRRLTEHANMLLGLMHANDETLIGIYIDNGFHGPVLKRPGFLRLLKDGEGGRITKLYLRDISRLSREHNELQIAYDSLKKVGIRTVVEANLASQFTL